MEDEPTQEKRYPLSTSKMSKTPSWIMLGFVLGAAFVASLPRREKSPPPDKAVFRAVESPRPREPRDPPQLTTIEAVFAEWGKHAVWSDDVTEVALWNPQDNAYTDYFEVRRFSDGYFFRTIPQLTRRIISRGKPIPESPLQFTETEEQYREWQSYGRTERPVERETSTRPRAATPPPAPTRIEPPVKMNPPALPPPQFPDAGGQSKN